MLVSDIAYEKDYLKILSMHITFYIKYWINNEMMLDISEKSPLSRAVRPETGWFL